MQRPRGLTYVTNEHGAVESHNLAADTQVSAKALFAALDGIGGQGKVQLRPQRAPVDAVVFASIMRHPTPGYYVFLYYTRPER
jgi:hypothetical protein